MFWIIRLRFEVWARPAVMGGDQMKNEVRFRMRRDISVRRSIQDGTELVAIAAERAAMQVFAGFG